MSTSLLATQKLLCSVAFQKVKLKAGDILTTAQYMVYQTSRNQTCSRGGEKLPFVSGGITRLVLIVRKTSNILFKSKGRYKMIASTQVEVPFYRSIGRQRGTVFGALAHLIGRTAPPFLRKFVFADAKRVVVYLLQSAVPGIAKAIRDRKLSRTAAKCLKIQTFENQLIIGSKTRSASRSIPTKSDN